MGEHKVREAFVLPAAHDMRAQTRTAVERSMAQLRRELLDLGLQGPFEIHLRPDDFTAVLNSCHRGDVLNQTNGRDTAINLGGITIRPAR